MIANSKDGGCPIKYIFDTYFNINERNIEYLTDAVVDNFPFDGLSQSDKGLKQCVNFIWRCSPLSSPLSQSDYRHSSGPCKVYRLSLILDQNNFPSTKVGNW